MKLALGNNIVEKHDGGNEHTNIVNIINPPQTSANIGSTGFRSAWNVNKYCWNVKRFIQFMMYVRHIICANILLICRCDVCQIETTDQGGLDMHFQGKKHKKKLNAIKWSAS